jgi:hypothetical protein
VVDIIDVLKQSDCIHPRDAAAIASPLANRAADRGLRVRCDLRSPASRSASNSTCNPDSELER